jgi:hypothetical protein
MSQVSEDINKTESRDYLNFDTCPEVSNMVRIRLI